MPAKLILRALRVRFASYYFPGDKEYVPVDKEYVPVDKEYVPVI